MGFPSQFAYMPASSYSRPLEAFITRKTQKNGVKHTSMHPAM